SGCARFWRGVRASVEAPHKFTRPNDLNSLAALSRNFLGSQALSERRKTLALPNGLRRNPGAIRRPAASGLLRRRAPRNDDSNLTRRALAPVFVSSLVEAQKPQKRNEYFGWRNEQFASPVVSH